MQIESVADRVAVFFAVNGIHASDSGEYAYKESEREIEKHTHTFTVSST